MAMTPHPLVAPGMAVLGALSVASLCAECIASRARVPVETVLAHLDEMNAARRRRNRRDLGPVEAYCQRCEMARPVYRLI
jgi:hypothetical protein